MSVEFLPIQYIEVLIIFFCQLQHSFLSQRKEERGTTQTGRYANREGDLTERGRQLERKRGTNQGDHRQGERNWEKHHR